MLPELTQGKSFHRSFHRSVSFVNYLTLLNKRSPDSFEAIEKIHKSALASVKLRTELGLSSVHISVFKKNIDELRHFITPDNIEDKDISGMTALLWAAYKGYRKMLVILIESGADVNARNHGGMTALHWAAHRGLIKTTQLLVENGARLNAKDNSTIAPPHSGLIEGYTPLDDAVMKRHEATSLFLIQKGGILSKRIGMNTESYTFYEDLLQRINSKKRVRKAIQATRNIAKLRPPTPEKRELVAPETFFCKHRGIDAQNSQGQTALHLAIINMDLEKIHKLLKYGASISIKDTKGRSPYRLSFELYMQAPNGAESVQMRRGILRLINRKYLDISKKEQEHWCHVSLRGTYFGEEHFPEFDAGSPWELTHPVDEPCDSPLAAVSHREGEEEDEDVNACDELGMTALHYAAQGNSETNVRKLLELGADPHILNKDKKAPASLCTDRAVRMQLIWAVHQLPGLTA
jgi:ankyrin repeat protein